MSIEVAVEMANAFIETCDAGDCNDDTLAIVWCEGQNAWLSMCAMHAAIEAEHAVEVELLATIQPSSPLHRP